ncbi:CsgG/HfaB family protein [Caballeronia mineralivorans]|nr:CsgG/HfaB family protein [Caballeronia mineralivorans]
MIGVPVFLAGCAAPGTIVPAQFAARTDAANYRRVAVLPFDGDGAEEATKDFESMLVSAQYDGKPYFTVIDRLTVQSAVAELKLQRSQLVDSGTTVKVGRLIGAQALYSGSAFVSPPAYSYSTEIRAICPANGDCRHIQVPCTTKTATFKLVPRLVDVSQARVVYSEMKSSSRSSYWCADAGVEQSGEILLREAVGDVFEQIREDVAPYVQNVFVNYKKDKENISDGAMERFTGSLDFAKSGRFDRACPMWSELARTNPASLALAYNVAACDEIAGNLDGAVARYRRIDGSLTRPDADVDRALARVTDEIAQRDKLREKALQASLRRPRNHGKLRATDPVFSCARVDVVWLITSSMLNVAGRDLLCNAWSRRSL